MKYLSRLEGWQIIARKYDCLEYLDVGGNLVMGTKGMCEAVVTVFSHFFMNYDLIAFFKTPSG